MPCYRCGTRQVDPARGESPWKRGVIANSQVLICPGCQASFDWLGELDRCQVCGSAHLVRRLGEIECRDCGSVRPPESSTSPIAGGLAADSGQDAPAAAGVAGAGTAPPGLAEEVERALERVLGRSRGTARIG